MSDTPEQQLNLIQHLLVDLHDKVGDVAPRLAAIEADLKEHMRRTEILESDVKRLSKSESIIKGGALVLGAIGSSALVLLKLLR